MINYGAIREELWGRMVSRKFRGLDPSAIKHSPRVSALDKKIREIKPLFLRKILRSLLYRALYYFGGRILRFIKPDEVVYAKGVALVLSGLAYAPLDAELKQREALIKLLLEKKLPGRYLWAHDVDYSFPGGQTVTKDTPNLITTAFVANAFFDMYRAERSSEWSELFQNIILDINKHIPHKRISADKICYMYTPVTDYHVHNANLLCAELLTKYLYLFPEGRKEFSPLINQALRYTLEDIDRVDGFPYAGPPTVNVMSDNYHTGYVLRSLREIKKYGGEIVAEHDLEFYVRKALDFYLRRFMKRYIVFSGNGLIQSHSLAEAMVIYKLFSERIELDTLMSYKKAIEDTVKLLWDDKHKYFYNNIKIICGIKIYDKTEMIRWSNAWMFYALSCRLSDSKNVNA